MLTAALVVVASTGAALALGAVDIPLRLVVDALPLGRAEAGPLTESVLQLRLPRTVEALTASA